MTDARYYPLRRIIEVRSLPIGTSSGKPCSTSAPHEVLECGHVLLGRDDAFGPTYPARRRCRDCADGKPPHVMPPGDGPHD